MLHTPYFSLQKPKGERKPRFPNVPYASGTVLGRFIKIISIPSWKDFEVGIFKANEVRGSMARCSRPWTRAADRLWTKSQLLTSLDLRRGRVSLPPKASVSLSLKEGGKALHRLGGSIN